LGLLDLPSPLYDQLNRLFAFLPSTVQLLVWAVICGVLSMWLYKVMSRQEEIDQLKQQSIAARKALSGYEGTEMDEVMPLAMNVLKLSGKHFITVIGPALLSSLPALTIIVWISNNFAYETPAAGSPVTVSVAPVTELQLETGANGTYRFDWPAEGETTDILDTTGAVIARVNAALSPVLHKKTNWNLLVANPGGYLPEDSKAELVNLGLTPIEYIPAGPAWLREWAALFFAALIAVSIGIKIAFRIH